MDLTAALTRHHHDPTRLVQILHDLHAADGHVSPDTITALAGALGLPRAQVEGVVGFYAFFSDRPLGRYRLRFSDNITDEMAGSRALARQVLDTFGIGPGQPGGPVYVDFTSCTGLCDQGPALLVNNRAMPRLTPARVEELCGLMRAEVPVEDWPADWFTVRSHILRRDLLLSADLRPGEALAAAIGRGRQGTIAAIEASGLRGRGGAGFSTATKWAACAAAGGDARYVVCNADEGEPGTFKDRELLTHHADAVLDGMTVAAWAVGASRGLLYLRAEYPFLVPHLQATLARRRAAGLLGAQVGGVPGFSFDVELHIGAGAYVCGEETALLESLEGRRGIPRNRPPYPSTHGYLGRPTVVHNVETLLAAAFISARGAEVFRAVGTPRSAGTKVLSISGDVARPGTYELPFGVDFHHILAAAGATDVLAVQVGGPSGTLLSADELDRRLALEDVPSAGALMVFNTSRDILAVVDNFTRFFAHESCGFCTPCRVGTTLNRQRVDRLVRGRATARDLADLQRVSRLMRSASHCGLGTTASNPITDALARFRPQVEARLSTLEDVPAFDLDASLAPARELTGRDDALAHLSDLPEPAHG